MIYKVKVKNPNKMFIVNNKPVRSPFQCFTNEDGLCLIKSRIKFYGLVERDYEIEEMKITSSGKDYSYIEEKRTPVKIINKEKNNSSLQVTKNNNVLIKEKNEVEKQKSTKQIKVDFTFSNSDPDPDPEQIINNQNNEVVEVKIEELSVKSSSILQKFLESEF